MQFFTLVVLLATLAAAAQAGAVQKYSFNLAVGSNGGKPFKVEGMGRITGVRMWDNSNYVYGLQLRYGDIWSARAGVPTGTMQEFDLYEDEAIIQVSGKFGYYIQYLHFGTSKGRFFIGGQPNGQCFNFYPEHYGAELRFISGSTHHGPLTGFSTHWGLVSEPSNDGKGF